MYEDLIRTCTAIVLLIELFVQRRSRCLCRCLKTLANEDTLLRTDCCRHKCSPFACALNICCGHKFCVRDTKMFLILFRNSLCPQQMFPSLGSPRNIMGNNVSPFTRALKLPNTLLILCKGVQGRVTFDQKFRFEFPKFPYVEWNAIFHQTGPISFYSRLRTFRTKSYSTKCGRIVMKCLS